MGAIAGLMIAALCGALFLLFLFATLFLASLWAQGALAATAADRSP
jgi:hypothetical protein